MRFVQIDPKATSFVQVPISRTALFALSEVCSHYGVSKSVALATAIDLFLEEMAKVSKGDALKVYVQQTRREMRQEALQEAIAIAAELEEHPETEGQAAALMEICEIYGFSVEDVIGKGKLASRSAEYVREMTKQEANPRTTFLASLLMPVGSKVPVAEIQQKWKEAGFPESMLNLTKRAIGAESVRLETQWVWQLPEKTEVLH